ncbi:MAG: hypothetical protein KatS3mg010_1398 [Acidimicrobiia bacterium]|nr:MAG: hypothetical protein KatS3mg010_1398 [Acidimicrobiia bacterium]
MCMSEVGRVVEIRDRAEAVVDVAGRRRTVSTVALVLDGIAPAPGDWLLVHTGFAVEVLDPQDAAPLAQLARELREAEETG